MFKILKHLQEESRKPKIPSSNFIKAEEPAKKEQEALNAHRDLLDQTLKEAEIQQQFTPY